MALFRPLPRPDSLEDLFLERYSELLRAALAITGGRREAEDLVHDAFVRLLLAQPDLASIEHLDAYLRAVLRNLHAARLRRRAHRAETPLSIADFDSAQFAARALTPSQWTQARYDVAAACRYACTRRLTSKTGSLFLLRFVHEIVPSDLARVVRLRRDTVDITLARGRAEVKTYLEHPARALEALGGGLVPMTMPAVEPGAERRARLPGTRPRGGLRPAPRAVLRAGAAAAAVCAVARRRDSHADPGGNRDLSGLPRSRSAV